jgi:hypothetical protein
MSGENLSSLMYEEILKDIPVRKRLPTGNTLDDAEYRILDEMAIRLCESAPNTGPRVMPTIAEVEATLGKVVKKPAVIPNLSD